jgi:hypothetical protein
LTNNALPPSWRRREGNLCKTIVLLPAGFTLPLVNPAGRGRIEK